MSEWSQCEIVTAEFLHRRGGWRGSLILEDREPKCQEDGSQEDAQQGHHQEDCEGFVVAVELPASWLHRFLLLGGPTPNNILLLLEAHYSSNQ